jgi:hypothetical protein
VEYIQKQHSINAYLPENIPGGKKRMQSSNPEIPGLPFFMVSKISCMDK